MTNSFNIEQLAWGKMNDLLPAIIQDCETQQDGDVQMSLVPERELAYVE